MSDIDDVLIEKTVPHYTELRPVLVGSFNISKAAIPYFQATMPLDEVAKGLQLVENLPSDLRQRWRLEELFQREIDWNRVEDEIVDGYLRLPEKLQFFNSLTVALLPLNDQSHLATAYGNTPFPPQPREAHTKAPWSVKDIGGVQLVTAERTPHGFIRWDPKRIFAATIDGQHRLAALKILSEKGNLTQQNLCTAVPVIFLVLDRRAGLELGEHAIVGDENPILTVVREIFIDLNHHSKPVARSRRILLDDQEIESRCVRRVMAERIGERQVGVLPLGLVHWQHKVTAKFNAGDATGPFITTVELLYAAVKDMLDVKPPIDPLDEKDVRGFLNRVEDALGVSRLIETNPARYPGLPPLGTYVERNYLKEGFEKPFASLPSQYLRVADDGFIERWQKPIVRILTEFKPYSDFIVQVDKRGGISGDLAFFLCLPERAQLQQVKEWGEHRYEKLDRPLKELAAMKSDDWAFFAVFQKGLLRATATGLRHYAVISGRSGATSDEFLDSWLPFLNELHSRGLFAVKCQMPASEAGERVGCGGLLWSGIAVNPGAKTVKWNDVTVSRIASLLQLWWYFYAQRRKSAPLFVSACERRDGNEKFPFGKAALKALRDGVRSSTVGNDEELADPELDARTKARIELIIGAARHGQAIDDVKASTIVDPEADTNAPKERPGRGG